MRSMEKHWFSMAASTSRSPGPALRMVPAWGGVGHVWVMIVTLNLA